MISQKDYCEHSGLSKGQVSKLVSRGMPLDSAEAADRWRGMTARPASRPAAPKASGPATPQPARPAESMSPPDSSRVSADTPAGAFERQKQIERAAYGLAAVALREGRADAGRLVQIHAAAAANLTRARQEVLALAEREGQLLSADWVRRIILDHDGAVVTLAKAMPRMMAGRIAPHDPEHAEAELQRWVDEEFLRTLHQTNPWKNDK